MRLACERTKRYGQHQMVVQEHKATLRYSESLRSWWVHLDPGVTGYESAEVAAILGSRLSGSWCACAGTEGSWDKLEVPAAEMEKLRDALRLIAPLLELVAAHHQKLLVQCGPEQKQTSTP